MSERWSNFLTPEECDEHDVRLGFITEAERIARGYRRLLRQALNRSPFADRCGCCLGEKRVPCGYTTSIGAAGRWTEADAKSLARDDGVSAHHESNFPSDDLQTAKDTIESQAEQIARLTAELASRTESANFILERSRLEIDRRLAAERRVAEVREECAKIVDDECTRILATQSPDATPTSILDSINQNIRMMAVLLPEIAAAIRASTDKENGNG